jgi:ABC-type branched-subunit amino acid transport system ATPase component
MSGTRLEARGITKAFGGVTAVAGVSLTAEPGQVTGVVGPNGAGKTTLLNLLTGVYRADAGELAVGGTVVPRRDWRPHRVARLGVARTFQSARVFPNLTVFDNVLLGAETGPARARARARAGRPGSGPAGRDPRAQTRALLAALGLDDRRDVPAGDLSSGAQKVVELGRMLLSRPEVLLLDEPASGLSESEAARLADTLVAVRDFGTTVVLVDHNLRLVMGICDQVVVMDAGTVIAAGPPEQVQSDPAVRAAYLGTAA